MVPRVVAPKRPPHAPFKVRIPGFRERPYQYIRKANGEVMPCRDIRKWAQWYETFENRVIKKDDIHGVEISTVFLGLDHNFSGTGPPVLWETMIFGGLENEFQRRYDSEEAALEGHARAVKLALAADMGQLANVWSALKRFRDGDDEN
jgi:hypothetical protein